MDKQDAGVLADDENEDVSEFAADRPESRHRSDCLAAWENRCGFFHYLLLVMLHLPVRIEEWIRCWPSANY